jgi:hypothetical protein
VGVNETTLTRWGKDWALDLSGEGKNSKCRE